MPKIFEAPFCTEEELKEMDESELTFPFSTEYMRYDGVKQQYIPTEELLTKHGIDLTGFLTSTGRNTPQNVNEELERAQNAIKELGGEIERVDNFYLSDNDNERNIIVIKKIKETNPKYPRKAGTPSKEPL